MINKAPATNVTAAQQTPVTTQNDTNLYPGTRWYETKKLEELVPSNPVVHTEKQGRVLKTLREMTEYRARLIAEKKAKKHHINEYTALVYVLQKIRFRPPKITAAGDSAVV